MFWLSVVLCAVAVRGNPTPATMPESYDTIIIGMGAAGCTAASTLSKAGKRVLGLEAMDRVGGRVNTVPFGDGVVELGAEWIHGQFPSRVYDLAIQNNVSILPQDLDFDVYRSDGSSGDKQLLNELMTFSLGVVDDPPQVPEPLGEYITKRLMDYIKTNHPTLLQDKDFIDNLLEFLDLVIDNYESSNSWNDVSTETRYTELDGHQHMSWHRNGYKTLFQILLNTYKNGPGYPTLDIKLKKEVSQISWPQDPNADVVVSCTDGTTYRAKNVIVTVSLGVLKERYNTLFRPQLPQQKVTSIQKLSIGVVGKVILEFEKAWWDKTKWFPFIWKSDDKKRLSDDEEWVTNFSGVSPPMGNSKSLTLWSCGEVAKLVETLPEDVVKRKVMELVRRFMGKGKTIPEPIAMLRSSWFSNPYTRGSYTYDNILTPQYPNARATLAEPLLDSSGAPRVLFAGEATDNTHFSTVHGATDTGFREASRLLPTAKL
ncbi:lysine-specific histone demethylase 1A-like isoform X2 [Helicoverpa zea]|uniref:lysine-specific histone demethylase 1A-like isoform X2 n=1 Tax=Helicoverpa zea TaxID=7113 RepID=UPI001F56EB25|nr:lysine-specific histone demethylase 1A-like isoform X2 [Helicoverpa zea]